MPNLLPRLSERDVRIRSLLQRVRNGNYRGTLDRAPSFPPLSSLVVRLIDATRSIWLDVDDFESWLNEARAATILREMLAYSTWENNNLEPTPLNSRLFGLIVQSLLIVQDSGLSVRRRDCLVANCHSTVERNSFRRSESRRSVEVNVILEGSGGHWCVGSFPIYPSVRPHQNSR
jgi:hypothetical protein